MITYHKFENREAELFGRQQDINFLLDRVENKGLTAIIGRPQMGKTWLLEQVGWILETQENYLVGYHESKGEGDDHLLRAVLDLYRRWLSSASLLEQAESIFIRHKENLISGVGRLFGAIFQDIIMIGGTAIKETLKVLESADRDLKYGGLDALPALDYDNALSLTRIVHEESKGKKLVLILDAWEKSPNIQKVYNTLDSFLKHSDDWCPCHILLGIRNPDPQNPDSQLAYELVDDLVKSSGLSKLWCLNLMGLDNDAESMRMLTYLRSIVPAAARLEDDELIRLIDGFPGVIKRFRQPSDNLKISEKAGLEELAQDAQNYRYREFEKLIPTLIGDQLTMAIRFAVFYRLNEESWLRFKHVLCQGIDSHIWEDLRHEKILDYEAFPYYGHDARHDCAFWNLKESRPERIKAELEKLIFGLASQIKYIDDRDRQFSAALVGLKEKVELLKLDRFHEILCLSAESLFREINLGELEQLNYALSHFSKMCPGAKFLLATAILSRGVRKGFKGDTEGAIADYTLVIDMPNVPARQSAMAAANIKSIKKLSAGK